MIGRVMPAAAALAAAGQAITAVRLAAVLDSSQPPLLALVLKCAGSGAGTGVRDGVSLAFCERPEDYRLALDPAPPEALDAAYLALAWELGAWDVARTERLPLAAGAGPLDPRHGIAHLLHDPYQISVAGQAAEPMPCPVDAAAWAKAAATNGWITWLCKPLRYGPAIRAGWINKDSTLRPDGGRDPRSWAAWRPVVRGADHQTIIRLGRAPHGNRGRRQP